MRLNAALAAALCSSATLLGQVQAQDADDVSTAVTESSTTSEIEKPTFTVRGSPPYDAIIPTVISLTSKH